MMGSIYNGMSAMMAFSKGLDNVSDNVSNLNTTGYKGKDLNFNDYLKQQQAGIDGQGADVHDQSGVGVTTNGTTMRFVQGELRNTGNRGDVAIDGDGLFVVQDGDQRYYTRSGEFVFNEDGDLVTRANGDKVMAFNDDGELTGISVDAQRAMEPKATTEVTLVGNIQASAQSPSLDEIVVFDKAGKRHELTLRLSKETADTPQWKLAVENQDGDVIAEDGHIKFKGDGTPEVDFNAFTFTFEPDDADPSEITLFFGEPGSHAATTAKANSDSNAPDANEFKVKEQDGYGVGWITDVSFNREGEFTLAYSNGETVTGPKLAIAWTHDINTMKQMGGNRFLAAEPGLMTLSTATADGMGEIKDKTIELSNVELTQEFTDMIIIQRGYQASSQIVSATNEMMQQTIEMLRARS